MNTIIPDPGIYHDIPNDAYHQAWDAINHTRLEWLDRSPRYCRAQMDRRDPPTPQMVLGSAVHAAILEPDTFASRFIEMPDFGDMRSRTRRDERDAWIAQQTATPLDSEDLAKCHAMRDAAYSHPTASKLLRKLSEVESSIAWIDGPTGLVCKARPDGLIEQHGVMLDLKTCRDSRPKPFASAFYDLGYWRQFPFYVDGLAACGRQFNRVVLVCVESEPPHEVRVYQVAEEAMTRGRDDNRRLIDLYAQYERDGWPEHADEDALVLSLPAWAK